MNLWNMYLKYRKPMKYAKKIGVSFGMGCRFYSTNFGSEPYLISMGNNVCITNGVKFITHDGATMVLKNVYHGDYLEDKIHKYGKICIGDNCFIGMNSIIMPGVKIGNNCVVAAGSVVTKDVADNTIVAGVPARKIMSLDEYNEKVLKQNLEWNHENYKKDKKKEILRLLN